MRRLQTEISVPVYEDMPTWLESLTRMAELGPEPTGLFRVTVDGAVRAVEFEVVLAGDPDRLPEPLARGCHPDDVGAVG